MAHTCPGSVVIVDADRVRAATLAVEKFQPDVILLDDAFQHRRIHRDVDILCFRSILPLGNGFCLPAGPLREPQHNMSRAQIHMINGRERSIPHQLFKHDVPQFNSDYVPKILKNKSEKSLPTNLNGTKVVAFCGLANPENFKRTLLKLNMNLLGFLAFKDHYKFEANDIFKVERIFEQSSAEIIVTTEKDWVKLPLDLLDEHWYRLQIEIKPTKEKELLSLFEILK